MTLGSRVANGHECCFQTDLNKPACTRCTYSPVRVQGWIGSPVNYNYTFLLLLCTWDLCGYLWFRLLWDLLTNHLCHLYLSTSSYHHLDNQFNLLSSNMFSTQRSPISTKPVYSWRRQTVNIQLESSILSADVVKLIRMFWVTQTRASINIIKLLMLRS